MRHHPLGRRKMPVFRIVRVRARRRAGVDAQRRIVELAVADLARVEAHRRELLHAAEEFLPGFLAFAVLRLVGERLEQRDLLRFAQLEEGLLEPARCCAPEARRARCAWAVAARVSCATMKSTNSATPASRAPGVSSLGMISSVSRSMQAKSSARKKLRRVSLGCAPQPAHRPHDRAHPRRPTSRSQGNGTRWSRRRWRAASLCAEGPVLPCCVLPMARNGDRIPRASRLPSSSPAGFVPGGAASLGQAKDSRPLKSWRGCPSHRRSARPRCRRPRCPEARPQRTRCWTRARGRTHSGRPERNTLTVGMPAARSRFNCLSGSPSL